MVGLVPEHELVDVGQRLAGRDGAALRGLRGAGEERARLARRRGAGGGSGSGSGNGSSGCRIDAISDWSAVGAGSGAVGGSGGGVKPPE